MDQAEYIGRFVGQVIKYNTEKSFGFISINSEEIKDDAFIYYKDIEPEKQGFKKLKQDQIVSFDLHRKPDGNLVAKKLTIEGDDEYGDADESDSDGPNENYGNR